jgi:hypothetical protein
VLDASKDSGVDVKAERTKYIFIISCHQTAGQNYWMKVASKSFETEAHLNVI